MNLLICKNCLKLFFFETATFVYYAIWNYKINYADNQLQYCVNGGSFKYILFKNYAANLFNKYIIKIILY